MGCGFSKAKTLARWSHPYSKERMREESSGHAPLASLSKKMLDPVRVAMAANLDGGRGFTHHPVRVALGSATGPRRRSEVITNRGQNT